MKEKDFLEQFINIYQLHPCLWNSKCKEYANKHMRNDAYDELVEFSKEIYPFATRDFVIRKIHNLRCAYRRELKKMLESQKKTGSSTDDVYVPNLWYFDLLSFIEDCETPRNGKCNLDGKNKQVEKNEESLVIEKMQDDSQVVLPLSPPNPPPAVCTSENSKFKSTKPPGSKMKPETELIKIASKTLQSFNERRSTPSPSIDECEIAGKKYACDLRNLSTNQRAIAEKLVSEVMFYAKLNELTPQSSVKIQHPSVYDIPPHPYGYGRVSTTIQQHYPSISVRDPRNRFENNVNINNRKEEQNSNESSKLLHLK